MMIDAELLAYLKANSELNSLIGGRIYPSVAPQNVTYPCIVYQMISNNDLSSFGGEVYENRVRFQFDIYDARIGICKQVLASFKNAIYKFRKYPHNLFTMDRYEKETRLYREMIDFKLTL